MPAARERVLGQPDRRGVREIPRGGVGRTRAATGFGCTGKCVVCIAKLIPVKIPRSDLSTSQLYHVLVPPMLLPSP